MYKEKEALLGTTVSGLAHRYLSIYLGGEQSQGK